MLLLDIDIINNSARQKIEEDLSVLDRQIRLQMGEDIKDEAESLAEAYLATPMVSLGDTLILIHLLNFFYFSIKKFCRKNDCIIKLFGNFDPY